MPFKSYPGVIGSDGTTTISIQQDNASVEWDIYQVSVNSPSARTIMTAQMFINGFFLTGTSQANADTAVGSPDVILSRSDIMTIVFSGGTPGIAVNVGIWYDEATAGTSNVGNASPKGQHI